MINPDDIELEIKINSFAAIACKGDCICCEHCGKEMGLRSSITVLKLHADEGYKNSAIVHSKCLANIKSES